MLGAKGNQQIIEGLFKHACLVAKNKNDELATLYFITNKAEPFPDPEIRTHTKEVRLYKGLCPTKSKIVTKD